MSHVARGLHAPNEICRRCDLGPGSNKHAIECDIITSVFKKRPSNAMAKLLISLFVCVVLLFTVKVDQARPLHNISIVVPVTAGVAYL